MDFIDHYLDDYIILGSPGTSQCQEVLTIVDKECRTLGVPLAAHKRKGPMMCITFLGILIDTAAGQLRLPPEKLSCLFGLLQE